MATLDEQIAAAQARIAAKQAAVTASTPAPVVTASLIPNSVGQGLFDVLTGVGKAATGLTDIATYPVAKAAQLAGYDVPTFGLTKALESEAAKTATALGLAAKTPTQELIEFMTPIPGLSKGRMIADALLGATSYFGMKGAEAIAPESQLAPIVGAIGAPLATQGAIGLARGIGSQVKPSIGVITGNEAALKAAAEKEIINTIGKEGVEALQQYAPAAPIVGVGEVPLTLAERVQTPAAAIYQSRARQSLGGSNVLVDALAQRQAAIDEAVAGIAPRPQQGELQLQLQQAERVAEAAKANREANILESLGLTDEAADVTPMTRGERIQQSLFSQKEAAKQIPQAAWEKVDLRLKLDADAAFTNALKRYDSVGPLEKKQFSKDTSFLFDRLRTVQKKENKNQLKLSDLQDIRKTALNIIRNSQTISDSEKAVVSKLVSEIDSENVKVLGDQASADAWIAARNATRKFKQQFAEGVVGEITAFRGLKPKLKTSQVINRALKHPENAAELMRKFEPTSIEGTEIRMELLSRLRQQKNPTNFLGANKDLYMATFGPDEYKRVNEFAQSVGAKNPFEEYRAISEATVPKALFENIDKTKRFVTQFKDTPVIDMARGKFVETRLLQKGDALDNLAKNQKIAQELFGDRLPELQAILRDQQILKTPDALQKEVTRGSQTFLNTALGALQSGRAGIETLRNIGRTGPLLGFGGGYAANLGMASFATSLLGGLVGPQLVNLAETRASQIDKYVAQILANPSLLPLAAAAPTESNIAALNKALTRAGILGTRVDTDISETTGPSEPQSTDEQLLAAQKRLAAKRAQLQ